MCSSDLLADATAQQTYFNTLAGAQQTQDVADAVAQQTFENGVADQYAATLATWSASVGNALRGVPAPSSSTVAWAQEQASFAAANDAWVHTVTLAQVNDVVAVDTAQTAWTVATNAAAVAQVQSDVAAWLTAQTQVADDADIAAGAQDNAWRNEVNLVAGDTNAYDAVAINAQQQQIAGEADDEAGQYETLAQLQVTEQESVDGEFVKLQLGQETGAQYGINVDQLAAALKQSFGQWEVYYQGQIVNGYQTDVQTTNAAKLTWVINSANDEAQ